MQRAEARLTEGVKVGRGRVMGAGTGAWLQALPVYQLMKQLLHPPYLHHEPLSSYALV